MKELCYGSVCSGIEAASIAWEPLGMRPVWFAEIESFPSAVLAHRWPHVANLGDMTKLAKKVLAGEIESPDVLVGGTPCQAFSIAGLRGGLDDERGALTLKYVELANAIDDKRSESFLKPTVIVWENVPGVLSSADNAFGCFLAGLAGEDAPFEPGDRPESGKVTRSGGGMAKPVAMLQSGRSVVVFMDRSERWPGESLMPNTSEWHNDADACLLSQVLEQTSIPQRYFLSSKACAGILRRAEKEGNRFRHYCKWRCNQWRKPKSMPTR